MKNFRFVKVLAVAPIAFALVSCGEGGKSKVTEINVNDYVDIVYSGYDSAGNVDSFSINFDKLVRDNLKAFDLDDDETTETDIEHMISQVSNCFDGEPDTMSNLSNGDTVVFKWLLSSVSSIEEEYPVTFIYSDKNFVVDGLTEPKSFDPFEYLSVTFDGIAPNGNAKLKTESNLPVSGIYFKADKVSGLSNDDVVKVTVECDYDSLEDICLREGLKPSAKEKDFTVEGLSAYATELSQIPDDVLEKMDSHARDTLNAHVASSWADAETFKNMELIGNYFLVPKDPSIRTDANNYIYFVYKIDAVSKIEDKETKEEKEEEFSYYYYSSFSNIMILDDGTCSFDLSSMQKPEGGSSWGETFTIGRYYYQGFQDIDTLFSKQVTAKIDKYSYESTVEDSEKEPETTVAEEEEKEETTTESAETSEDTTKEDEKSEDTTKTDEKSEDTTKSDEKTEETTAEKTE